MASKADRNVVMSRRTTWTLFMCFKSRGKAQTADRKEYPTAANCDILTYLVAYRPIVAWLSGLGDVVKRDHRGRPRLRRIFGRQMLPGWL